MPDEVKISGLTASEWRDAHDKMVCAYAGAREQSSGACNALKIIVEHLLTERARLRAAGRFAEADAIRDLLILADINVLDYELGTKWGVSCTLFGGDARPAISMGE